MYNGGILEVLATLKVVGRCVARAFSSAASPFRGSVPCRHRHRLRRCCHLRFAALVTARWAAIGGSISVSAGFHGRTLYTLHFTHPSGATQHLYECDNSSHRPQITQSEPDRRALAAPDFK